MNSKNRQLYLQRRQTAFPEHIVQFSRYLRQHKYRCGIQEEREALQALSNYVPPSNDAFLLLLQSIFAKNKDQFLQFPSLFHQYWKEISKAEDSKLSQQAEENRQPKPRPNTPSLQALKDWLFRGNSSDTEEIAVFSPVEAFTQKDFSSFSALETEEVMDILRQLARLLDRQKHRRYIRSRKPFSMDLKRSIRKNISRGGEIDYLLFKKRKPSRLKITLFCDVSKSMDLYARFLIQFMYGFHRLSAKVETFVFSTSLTHISPALNNRDLEECLAHLGDLVDDWSGGTNLGKTLAEYKQDYGRKFLGNRTTAIILSDGWDQGDPGFLQEQLSFIRNHSQQLIWINPLAGNPGYEARTSGMLAALPYVDHFTSAHNVETLVNMVRQLGKGRHQMRSPLKEHQAFRTKGI